ncbi:microfibril-associated glycoprotein 4-like [Styela clava]
MGSQNQKKRKTGDVWSCSKKEILLASLALHVTTLLMFIVCLILLIQMKSQLEYTNAICHGILETPSNEHVFTIRDETEVFDGIPPFYGCAEFRYDEERRGTIVTDSQNTVTLYPFNNQTKSIIADCVYNGTDSWLVIQRRLHGTISFYRDWESYASGFGKLGDEYWIGLRNLHLLTSGQNYRLQIVLTSWEDVTKIAEYSSFYIANEPSNFSIAIYGYSGNADDGMTYHSGQSFSTYDRENDENFGNCAKRYHGGWWYKRCYHANLNGRYYNSSNGIEGDGVAWSKWLGDFYSLKSVEMRIQPNPM